MAIGDGNSGVDQYYRPAYIDNQENPDAPVEGRDNILKMLATGSEAYDEDDEEEQVPIILAVRKRRGHGRQRLARRRVKQMPVFQAPPAYEPRARPARVEVMAATPKKTNEDHQQSFQSDMARSMANMEQEMEKQMQAMMNMQKRFQEEMEHGVAGTGSPKQNSTTAESHSQRSVSADYQTPSKEFIEKETIEDCDAKTGICQIEKCENGNCVKMTQLKNGTVLPSVSQEMHVLKEKKPEKKDNVTAGTKAQ